MVLKGLKVLAKLASLALFYMGPWMAVVGDDAETFEESTKTRGSGPYGSPFGNPLPLAFWHAFTFGQGFTIFLENGKMVKVNVYMQSDSSGRLLQVQFLMIP